jgi:hypothetical protein
MHLSANLAKRIWQILVGDYRKVVNGRKKGEPLITKEQARDIGVLIGSSRQSVPLTFAGECRNIDADASTLRSIDWIHFARFLVPTVVVHFLRDEGAKAAFLAVSNVISLALQKSINDSTIKAIQDNIRVWFDWRRTSDSISNSVFTINMHYLIHLPFMLVALGPTHAYSCFNMERAIREYKNELDSSRNPAVNAANVLVDLAAARRRHRIQTDPIPVLESDYETGLVQSKKDKVFPGCDSEAYELWDPKPEVKVSKFDSDVPNQVLQNKMKAFLESSIDSEKVATVFGAAVNSNLVDPVVHIGTIRNIQGLRDGVSDSIVNAVGAIAANTGYPDIIANISDIRRRGRGSQVTAEDIF